jgi:hypothetical protein
VSGGGRRRAGQRYEIRIAGQLGELLLSAFPGMLGKPRGEDTILSGVLADQAALWEVLTQIEVLGLELVEVRRVHWPDNGASH